MKEFKFMPPTKFKILNWINNILLVVLIILSMIFIDGIVEKTIS